MIAIIFELTPKSDKKADYLEPAAEMRPMIEEVTSLDYLPISGSPPLPDGPENKSPMGSTRRGSVMSGSGRLWRE
jgi:hypothetical protein